MDCGLRKKCSCDLEYCMLYLKRFHVVCLTNMAGFILAHWKEMTGKNAAGGRCVEKLCK